MNITETERIKLKSEGARRRAAYQDKHPREAVAYAPQFGDAIEKKRRRKA